MINLQKNNKSNKNKQIDGVEFKHDFYSATVITEKIWTPTKNRTVAKKNLDFLYEDFLF